MTKEILKRAIELAKVGQSKHICHRGAWCPFCLIADARSEMEKPDEETSAEYLLQAIMGNITAISEFDRAMMKVIRLIDTHKKDWTQESCIKALESALQKLNDSLYERLIRKCNAAIFVHMYPNREITAVQLRDLVRMFFVSSVETLFMIDRIGDTKEILDRCREMMESKTWLPDPKVFNRENI